MRHCYYEPVCDCMCLAAPEIHVAVRAQQDKDASTGENRGRHWNLSEGVMGCSLDMLLGNAFTGLYLIWLCGSHPAYGDHNWESQRDQKEQDFWLRLP